MSSSSYIVVLATLAFFMVSSTFGHSQMRCAKYDMATGACSAPIRSEGVSFTEQASDMLNGGGICQVPMTNPISAAYGNGAGCGYAPCPTPMGTFHQGETFTIMWLARNHAEADQTPGNISLYVSPVETMDQGVDVSVAVFGLNKFCTAPFMSCNGQNGDMIQCYATCTLPTSTAVGTHTLWWKWDWRQANEKIYTTCADINVVAGSGPSTPVSATTMAATTAAPMPVTTAAAMPMTTAAPVPVTTGAPMPVTTMAPKPVTTAAPVPVTTAAPMPVTTAAPMPMTTAAMPVTTAKVMSAPVTTASAPAPVTSTLPCNLGDQICVGTSQYQTCTNGRDANYWAAPQNCNVNTHCQKSTNANSLNKIYCV